MRSLLKNVVAILRTTIGLTQKDLAELAGCSLPTVQSIELGRLKLSEALATRLAENTGADIGWLLANDTGQPIRDQQGRPYTRATYERYQAQKRYREGRPEGLADELVDYLFLWTTYKEQMGMLAELLAHCYRKNTSRLCAYKIDQALLEVGREMMVEVEAEEAARWRELDKARASRGPFFLNGLPETLLYFQGEIEGEFRRRIKQAGVKGEWKDEMGGTEACLREFQATQERMQRAAASASPEATGQPEAGGRPGATEPKKKNASPPGKKGRKRK